VNACKQIFNCFLKSRKDYIYVVSGKKRFTMPAQEWTVEDHLREMGMSRVEAWMHVDEDNYIKCTLCKNKFADASHIRSAAHMRKYEWWISEQAQGRSMGQLALTDGTTPSNTTLAAFMPGANTSMVPVGMPGVIGMPPALRPIEYIPGLRPRPGFENDIHPGLRSAQHLTLEWQPMTQLRSLGHESMPWYLDLKDDGYLGCVICNGKYATPEHLQSTRHLNRAAWGPQPEHTEAVRVAENAIQELRQAGTYGGALSSTAPAGHRVLTNGGPRMAGPALIHNGPSTMLHGGGATYNTTYNTPTSATAFGIPNDTTPHGSSFGPGAAVLNGGTPAGLSNGVGHASITPACPSAATNGSYASPHMEQVLNGAHIAAHAGGPPPGPPPVLSTQTTAPHSMAPPSHAPPRLSRSSTPSTQLPSEAPAVAEVAAIPDAVTTEIANGHEHIAHSQEQIERCTEEVYGTGETAPQCDEVPEYDPAALQPETYNTRYVAIESYDGQEMCETEDVLEGGYGKFNVGDEVWLCIPAESDEPLVYQGHSRNQHPDPGYAYGCQKGRSTGEQTRYAWMPFNILRRSDEKI